MKIEEIAPFVRFCCEQSFVEGRHEIVCCDNRIFFCIGGTGKIIVEGITYNINENTFLMWRAGKVYSFSSDTCKPINFITCNFDYDNRNNHLSMPIPPEPKSLFFREHIVGDEVVFEDNLNFNNAIYLQAASNLRNLMIALKDEYNKKRKFYRLKLSAILSEVLTEVARMAENDTYIQSDALMADIFNYIQEHLKESLTNAEIGTTFGYHPNYLNTLFISHTGMSLHKYIIKCKLSKGLQLLMETDCSIKQISEKVGIEDSLYFSKLFKKYFLKSPRAYRKFNQNL